jgi:hypothetical protein
MRNHTPLETHGLEASVRKYLTDPEHKYLVKHYREGDTGVVGWVAGVTLVTLPNFTIDLEVRKRVAKKVLEELISVNA